MFIKSLLLKNFRNYEVQELSFEKGVNIIYGDNGQGKTNILEALFLASIGKSFRTAHDAEMIRENKEAFEVLIKAGESEEEGAPETEIKICYNRQKQKSIRVNGNYLRKMGNLMGTLPAVIFSPTNMMLLSAGPSERRKFMDMALCQLKPVYFFDLQQYNKILMQKNAFLRDPREDRKNKTLLEVWNLSLAEYGARISEERTRYLEKVKQYAAEYHLNISGKNEEIEIRYVPSGSSDKQEFYKMLQNAECREEERRMCLLGPHKDDLEICLKNTGDIRKYGSQGQKRTCILALKLAETRIFEEQNGIMPILLLDDVLSELDIARQEFLLREIKETQTFITCTDPERLKNGQIRNRKSFLIENGKVVISRGM